ncbi:repressor [Streptomyces sp. CB00455]|uniref:PaaX family transcriptional regulator C-terminal domain-containing protein n=1 Tax=Streptomyces sp. CB00455 TaxID=1703927 RepID=UPI00093BE45A|nr:PaaX family transcriptional regulator C-terminal domain-containing protein [Streptomyces sp. CB00455]OKK18349.1 repressor [Streptomyces sp. CB00455]
MTPARPAVPTRLVVHALVREDGTVDAGELYEVAGLLGMTDQQVRLCVKRLVAEGRFTVEGRGRRAVLRVAGSEPGAAVGAQSGAGAGARSGAGTGAEPGAGPGAERGAETRGEPGAGKRAEPGAGAGPGAGWGSGPGLPLVPEVEFVRYAYRQDRGLEPWDGVWHLFAFAVPESARAARDALRDTLTSLGAAPVQGGLYATPNAIGPYVRARAAELGLSAALTGLTTRDLAVGTTTDPRALAARLWPLDEIASRYASLHALATAPRPAAGGGAAASGAGATGAEDGSEGGDGVAGLARAVALAAAFGEAMHPDPLLPPELLPQPWPGTAARAAAAEAWDRLRAGTPPGGPRLFRLYGEAVTRSARDTGQDH